MCVVSAMGNHYNDRWKDLYPFPRQDPFQPLIPSEPIKPIDLSKFFGREVTREEFDELKKEVEEMRNILKIAAEYDKKNNEPHCEMEDKVALLKKMAALFGISLEDVFGPEPKKDKII